MKYLEYLKLWHRVSVGEEGKAQEMDLVMTAQQQG
jgi:hypothetical protein